MTRLEKLAEFRFQLRRFLNFSELESERFGIGAQQYQLMQVIGAMPPGEAASISYLAERMILRHNSTVELVDRAERAELVKRTSDQRDLRRSIVVLTPKGEQILQRLIEAHLAQLEGDTGDHLLRSLSELRGSGASAEDATERSL
ncbi:MAG TPA: MarR family transcriptional regulator [Acidobacteriaceae bacterium]|nr:MarR family transcriptional regulator [Acidobacteriaceae bacterium]